MRRTTPLHLTRAAVLAVAVLLAVAAVFLVTALHDRANENRDAALDVANVTTSLNELLTTAFSSNTPVGGTSANVRLKLAAIEASINATTTRLQRDRPTPELMSVAAPLRSAYALLERIRLLGSSAVGLTTGLQLGALAQTQLVRATALLKSASDEYQQRSKRSLLQATLGSGAVIAILLAGFALFYRRSWVLAENNERLLADAQHEAVTDVLTGIGNRRAFMTELESIAPTPGDADPVVLVLLDLNGFKDYNDTFGHPAGDALLTRLAHQLAQSMSGIGSAYRLGGDEFCVLARSDDGEQIARTASDALAETGEGFEITSSSGVVLLPEDAASPEAALGLADQRMYSQKTTGRVSARRQTADVLMTVLGERDPGLAEHVSDVGCLAQAVARRMDLSPEAVEEIRLAADLHDIGKTAIPDSILDKPGPLDPAEWEYMHRHTQIGERILLAAPALAHTAPMVRASHERIDGTGYPDGLHGDEIPIGARIISVCDAFDAMISCRPYRTAMTTTEAVAELTRCSGTHFDPEVILAFHGLVASPGWQERGLGAITGR